MYTIKKGKYYVKDSAKFGALGGKSSYTLNPNYAVKYKTEEEAKRNACGNEQVVKMTYILA